MGWCAVPPCPAGLLQIVLQRSRDVSMYHEANVRLVDPHTEGIGRCDHPQIADAKRLLYLLLFFRGKTRVIALCGETLRF